MCERLLHNHSLAFRSAQARTTCKTSQSSHHLQLNFFPITNEIDPSRRDKNQHKDLPSYEILHRGGASLPAPPHKMTWEDALERVEPGQVPSEAPASLRTWTSQTLYGLLGGMLFGGYRGLQQARNRVTPSPIPTTSMQHRMAVFFVRESILTGARIGVFASVFSAAALAAEAATGAPHPATYATAGALTCGLFGGAAAGRVAIPAAAGFGAVTAGAAGIAHAGLQDALDRAIGEQAQEEDPEVMIETQGQEQGSVATVVQHLEENLSAHPLRIHKQEDDVAPAEVDPIV